MNDPPSHPSVSVEETENGYIVHAGSAVARISKTVPVYTVDADSQVLKEEYNLSPGVARTRKSIRDIMLFSPVSADNTLLILKTSCNFFLLSQAVEMVCGFLPENFPEEDEWKLLTSWKSERDVPAEPEIVNVTDAVEENMVDDASQDNANEKLEGSLSDIVSKDETKTIIPPKPQVEPEYSPDVLKIYEAISKLPRYHFGQEEIPNVNSGILFIFEDGEKYGDYDRITHIACDSGNYRLTRMIKDITTGDRYVTNVRKYIEEAVILKSGVNYVTTWQKNNFHSEVSSYISEHLSYSVLEIKPTIHRTATVQALLSTLIAEYSKHPCSDTWLGRYHSNTNILKRGMWNLENMGGVNIPFDADTLSQFLDDVSAILGEQNQLDTEKTEEISPIPNQSTNQTDSASVLAALRIHHAVSKLPRYRFDTSTRINVKDGLLIVFEDGEKYGDDDRIVYVGINQKSGRLPGRIHDIVGGHKDGAVLRKYIGEALLRKDGHPYARIWAKDSSSPKGREKIGTFYDQKKQDETEVRVTAYLKEHMSFSVIEIPNATRRNLLQDELVLTLKEAYSQLPVSSTWLGRYHSDLKIRAAALWMVGNERARPFNNEEVETFLKEIQNSQSLESVAKSTSSTSETISEVPSPVEQTSEENNAYSVNEEPTLDDVLRMENTYEKERILLKVGKHHLRELGVEGSRVLALAPLILHPGVPKSKITLSFGPGYSHTAISTCIDNLIAEKVITKYQFQRIGRKRVTYYKFTDVEKFISDLDTQKEEKLRVVSTSLETVIKSLEDEYHLPEEEYITCVSEESGEIQEKLINPIILLGLTQEAAQLLVYLHLFKEVTEEKVQAIFCQLTNERKVALLRKFFTANWIGTKEAQKRETKKWENIQLYHLTQPLEDILLNYALYYGEGLNNSVMELRKIIAYLAEHPLTILEGSVIHSYDEEREEEKSDENAEFRSFSWKVNPEISAVKTLDKSAFQYHNSGVPKAVCPFFGVDKLPRGGKRTIYLNYLSKRFTGYLVRDFGGSHSVKIYWDKDFANILSEYQAINGDELSLAFIKMPETDTYNLKVAKIGNSEEEITPVPVDARREERKVESPKPQYSQNTQILPEKKVEEIVDTEIQKSVYKYSTLVGNIDNWKKLYLTVKPYRAATIKDMGADFSLYNVSDSRNRILLGNELTSIINIEGPISRQQLIQRVMDLHSIPRLGEKIEGNILYSLRVLVNQGRIRRSKDAEQEYYSSKLNPILPRKRNYVLNISFSEISPDEIRVMIISHLLKENRCMKNTLIRDVYRGLGYQSQINHDISRRIERVLHDMISDGIIKIENQKVSFVTE